MERAMGVKNRPVLGAMFGICALLAAGDLESARAQNLDNPTWPTHEWLTSTPEEQGMDSSTLAKFVTDGEELVWRDEQEKNWKLSAAC
jgi:hypothetical protein